jgi:magnesium-transporting ATPase (P-type)
MENNMTIALIIVAYIANVFLNRWLDKLIIKKTFKTPSPFFWFFSLFATIVLLFVIIENNNSKFINWFTGKHW